MHKSKRGRTRARAPEGVITPAIAPNTDWYIYILVGLQRPRIRRFAFLISLRCICLLGRRASWARSTFTLGTPIFQRTRSVACVCAWLLCCSRSVLRGLANQLCGACALLCAIDRGHHYPALATRVCLCSLSLLRRTPVNGVCTLVAEAWHVSNTQASPVDCICMWYHPWYHPCQHLQKLTHKGKHRFIAVKEIASFKKMQILTPSLALVVKAMQGTPVCCVCRLNRCSEHTVCSGQGRSGWTAALRMAACRARSVRLTLVWPLSCV